MNYIPLALLWIVWCTMHSFLISMSVTDYLKEKMGSAYRFYRLFYNLLAVITLLPIIYYGHTLKSPLLFSWKGIFVIFQFIFFIIAMILFITGARKYHLMQFLGLKQIQSGQSHASLSESGKIDMSGVLGIIRHPWYLGAIIIIWVVNRDIYMSTLIMNVILTVYLIVGTYLEERKLTALCGDRYRNYQKKVSMLIPVKWVRAKFNLY